MQRKSVLKETPIYKEHRIHTSRLPSGRWLSTLVRLGGQRTLTKDSLTAAVTRVPGEYGSELEALQAAKRYVDAEEEESLPG
jgi:hypothetical protein